MKLFHSVFKLCWKKLWWGMHYDDGWQMTTWVFVSKEEFFDGEFWVKWERSDENTGESPNLIRDDFMGLRLVTRDLCWAIFLIVGVFLRRSCWTTISTDLVFWSLDQGWMSLVSQGWFRCNFSIFHHSHKLLSKSRPLTSNLNWKENEDYSALKAWIAEAIVCWMWSRVSQQ